jgi:hypothetical protein
LHTAEQASLLTFPQAGLFDPDNYESTPLDFINNDKYIMHLIWDYYIRILHTLHIPLFSRRIKSRPHDRIRSDRFLKTELDFEILACVVILSFATTFMCAWNFYFPSPAERNLWHAASVFFLFFCAIGGSYTWYWHVRLFEKYQATLLPSIEMGTVHASRQDSQSSKSSKSSK